MLFRRDLLVGSLVVALAYLGESLYGPVIGSIAQSFGRAEQEGYAFISAAFYGSAVSGIFILLFARDWSLERRLASALILGATLNLLALNVSCWNAAIGLRLGAGICFGTAVGGVVILLAQSASGVLLARQMSVMFSVVFLLMTPAIAGVPHLAARMGLEHLGSAHVALCIAAALIVRVGPRRSCRAPKSLPFRLVREALPRIFWSGRKSLSFGLHAANLFAAILLMIGIPPALSAMDVSEATIGLVLAALSGTTFVGGFVHSHLSGRFGVTYARWVLITTETAVLAVAAAIVALVLENAAILAALALTTKGICGGPPSFEAMMYSFGPTDPAASGLQRSLGMIAAITAATLVLGVATRLEIDVLSVMIAVLGLAYAGQIAAFTVLSRDPDLMRSEAGLAEVSH